MTKSDPEVMGLWLRRTVRGVGQRGKGVGEREKKYFERKHKYTLKPLRLPNLIFLYFTISLFLTGLILYFAYGIHHSNEGRSVSYGPMVTYAGEADISTGTLDRMSEEVVQQQPPRKDEKFGGL